MNSYTDLSKSLTTTETFISRSLPSTPVLTVIDCLAEPTDERKIRDLLDGDSDHSSDDFMFDDNSDSITISSVRTMHRKSLVDLFENEEMTRHNSLCSNFSNCSLTCDTQDDFAEEEFLFAPRIRHGRSKSVMQPPSSPLVSKPHDHRSRRMSVTSQLAQLMLVSSATKDLSVKEAEEKEQSDTEQNILNVEIDYKCGDEDQWDMRSSSSDSGKPKSLRDHPLISPNPHQKEIKLKAQFFTNDSVTRKPPSMIRSLFGRSPVSQARRFSMSALKK